jgi:hypothetical protein
MMKKLPWILVVLLAFLLVTAEGQEQFANFAQSTLATAVDADDTSVVVQTGDGAKFPTCCTGSQDFYVVLQTGTTQEVVRVTNRSTDTLTVVRAQQGTSGASFGIGSRVEQRVTRGTLERLQALSNFFTPTDDRMLVADGSNWVSLSLPTGCNATTQKSFYNSGSNSWTCEADAGGSGASLTRINGSSGAAGADFTAQKLSSNCASNATTTLATCMTTTGVDAGTWTFSYTVIYQSTNTAAGVDFGINHSGTVTHFVGQWCYPTTGTTTATAAFDQATSNTATIGECKGNRAINTKFGATLSTDTANADSLALIQGIIVVTASGSLTLQHASEVTTATQVMAETSLELRKIG